MEKVHDRQKRNQEPFRATTQPQNQILKEQMYSRYRLI